MRYGRDPSRGWVWLKIYYCLLSPNNYVDSKNQVLILAQDSIEALLRLQEQFLSNTLLHGPFSLRWKLPEQWHYILIVIRQVPSPAHRKTIKKSISALILKASTNKTWAAHGSKVTYWYQLPVQQNNWRRVDVISFRKMYSWFQTFAVIWILNMFFWVFPRRQIIVGRRFGTLYRFHLQRLVVDCGVWEEARCNIYPARVVD